MKCITNAIIDAQRKDENNQLLLESLAILYEYQKLFDKSFVIYINLKDLSVFEFLNKHDLYDCAFDNIIHLINLNKEVKFILII
jgi:hypothetical protein